VLSPGIATFLLTLAKLQLYRRDVAVFINEWAKENIPRTAKILFDNYAFLDPNWFKNVTQSTIMHWPIVAYYDPDYLILNACLPTSLWYRELMISQHRERDDADAYSVRIYQDLFEPSKLGPSGVQGVDFIADIEPQPLPAVEPGWSPPERPAWLGFAVSRIWITEMYLLEVKAAWDSARHPKNGPVQGCGSRVFRINPPGTPNGRPVPLSSSMAKGHPPNLAFDRNSNFFQAADGDVRPFLGYDFGDQSATKVSAVRIQWVVGAFTPPSIVVEYSDDGATWVRCGEYEVNAYSDRDMGFRTDRFPVTVDGAHRFWRVVATTLPRGPMAIAGLNLDAAGGLPATAR
jgi:hypothetical protein